MNQNSNEPKSGAGFYLRVIGVSLAVFILCFLLVKFWPSLMGEDKADTKAVDIPALQALPVKETAFDRVKRTHVLRCGYFAQAPWFFIDPATMQKGGYSYDVVMEIAAKSQLQVEWVEEMAPANATQSLADGRYDMMCSPLCVDAAQAQTNLYTTTVMHVPTLAIVRAGDKRFQRDKAGIGESLNAKGLRILVKRDVTAEDMAAKKFPNAERVQADLFASDHDMLQMLMDNKADVAFTGKIAADMFDAGNPGKINILNVPVDFCNGAYLLPPGEHDLKQLVDNAIMTLNAAGTLDMIAQKHMPLDPRHIKMPDMPYRDCYKVWPQGGDGMKK